MGEFNLVVFLPYLSIAKEHSEMLLQLADMKSDDFLVSAVSELIMSIEVIEGHIEENPV